MSEYDPMLTDLQQSLQRMTEDRDYWKKVATILAINAISQPHTYYGRSLEYVLADAQKDLI